MSNKIFTAKGEMILVDDKDYEWLNQWKWRCHPKGYATRTVGKTGILMHRLIMDASKHVQIDHINRNKLDNRRNNLRFCNNSENHFNRTITKRSTSGVKGVYWSSQKLKWRIQIQHKGKFHFFGYYDDLVVAKKVAKEKYKKLAGEFA